MLYKWNIIFDEKLPSTHQVLDNLKVNTGLDITLKDLKGKTTTTYLGTYQYIKSKGDLTCQLFREKIEFEYLDRSICVSLKNYSKSYFLYAVIHALLELGGKLEDNFDLLEIPIWGKLPWKDVEHLEEVESYLAYDQKTSK